MKNFSLCALAVLILSTVACSTAQIRTMPQEDGYVTIVAADIEKGDAEKEAADAATKYCKKLKQRAVFAKQETKYVGQMAEDTRNTVRTASKVASMVGFQSRNAGSRPSNIETAGDAGIIATNDRDYESTVRFKCQ